jgi:hypothetical protein
MEMADGEILQRSASPKDVLQLLEKRDFAALKGILESEELEFKRQPYFLETPFQKYAFVEDIVSFANHIGGLIVIGLETTKDPNLEGDFVTSIRPFPKVHCQFETFRSLCNEFIYPPIKGLRWFFIQEHEGSDESGFAAIEIPPAGPADRPHLINHVLNIQSGKKSTTQYSLSQRTGGRNSSYPVQSVHGLIKLGATSQILQTELLAMSDRLEKIEELLQPKNQTSLRSPSQNRRQFLEQVGPFLQSVSLDTRPTLVLAAYPSRRMTIPGLFDAQSSVGRAFDIAPELRHQGFGFTLDSRPELLGGTTRRIAALGYKARQLTSRGELFVAVPADEDFLAWFQQRRPGKPIYYKSFILAEVSYLFAKYVKQVFDSLHDVPDLDIMVGLRNCFVDGIPPVLSVGRDHNPMTFRPFDEPKPAPRPNLLKTVRVPSSISIERLAFEVQASLYRRFGFGDELVPYATLEAEGRVTRDDEILNPNRA